MESTGGSALLTWLSATAFTVWGTSMPWIEVLAFALALWMVACNMRVHPMGWPLAIVSSALYGLLFWQSKLYGEAALQLMFVALAAWGWRRWLITAPGAAEESDVQRLSPAARWPLLSLTLAGWLLLGWCLQEATDSDVPYLDALPTVGSLVGQYLLARKLLENWGVWAVVNAFSIVLFAVKGLWLTVLLYALLLLLSVLGWRQWAARLQTNSVRVPC